MPYGEEFVGLCYLPIFWIAGEDLGLLIPFVLGGTSVLMRRWDSRAVLDACVIAAPTIILFFLFRSQLVGGLTAGGVKG